MNKHITYAIEQIEENLTNDIAVSDLAKASGYSVFHFIRLFKAEIGFTPADYIRKRRLSQVARYMDESDCPISSIAFNYGFNSKENFTRAFKAEHSVLPTEYKAIGNSLKLYGDTPPAPLLVEPEIATLSDFSLTVYSSDENFPPNFWNKYNCREYSKKLSGGASALDYGVCLWNDELCKLDYWIGIRTSEANGDTSETITLNIPGGQYAVFTSPSATHFDFVATIHQTWEFINNVWLPNSGYRYTGSYEFESYAEESRTYSEKIYIPVERL